VGGRPGHTKSEEGGGKTGGLINGALDRPKNRRGEGGEKRQYPRRRRLRKLPSPHIVLPVLSVIGGTAPQGRQGRDFWRIKSMLQTSRRFLSERRSQRAYRTPLSKLDPGGQTLRNRYRKVKDESRGPRRIAKTALTTSGTLGLFRSGRREVTDTRAQATVEQSWCRGCHRRSESQDRLRGRPRQLQSPSPAAQRGAVRRRVEGQATDLVADKRALGSRGGGNGKRGVGL